LSKNWLPTFWATHHFSKALQSQCTAVNGMDTYTEAKHLPAAELRKPISYVFKKSFYFSNYEGFGYCTDEA